uniref:Zinc finger MYM-type protein 1-like n=1 Tax=Trichogramma kaykai TaxID=54128 RepID=A0ABD2X0A9_9HYME
MKQKCNLWKQVLRRIVDTILMLASCNLALRGHREQKNDDLDFHNRGNFLSVIEFLAKYDGVLLSILNSENKKINYLSPQIQNELITLLSVHVRKTIINDIQKSKYYSIILDTTQDISKKEQLSVIIRFVNIEYDDKHKLRNLKIQESFLGFFQIVDPSAQGLEEEILKILKEYDIPIEDCRGQGYDGASVMSGIYSGLQKRISNIQPKAGYIHCLAHNLNLVLEDSVRSLVLVQNHYETLQQLYAFFSASIRRWDVLIETMKAHSLKYPVVKKLCGTRWSSRHDAIYACQLGFRPIMKSLLKINLITKDKDTKNEAMILYKRMNKFEFVTFIVMECKILEMTNMVSKELQKANVDLFYASELLKLSLDNLNELRNNFEKVIEAAQVLASSWEIEAVFENKRVRKVKSFFDELSKHEAIGDPRHSFEVNVFNAHLDIIIEQLSSRFEGTQKICNNFRCIFPKNLINMNDEDLRTASEQLFNIYSEEISSDFTSQLLSLRNMIKKNISRDTSVLGLLEYLIENHSFFLINVPDVMIIIKLYLTLPVTVASAERSFSKLKLIKNYLRSSMSQARLYALALLSIECERTKQINIDKIIDDFAEKNVRRSKRFE